MDAGLMWVLSGLWWAVSLFSSRSTALFGSVLGIHQLVVLVVVYGVVLACIFVLFWASRYIIHLPAGLW